MGNLMETIGAYRVILEDEAIGKDNTLMIVTSNGIYFGTPILAEKITTFKTTDDLMQLGYYQANYSSEEEVEDESFDLPELKLDETILLKDVKYKTGNVVVTAQYLVLNLNQVISVQIGFKDTIEKILGHQ